MKFIFKLYSCEDDKYNLVVESEPSYFAPNKTFEETRDIILYFFRERRCYGDTYKLGISQSAFQKLGEKVGILEGLISDQNMLVTLSKRKNQKPKIQVNN